MIPVNLDNDKKDYIQIIQLTDTHIFANSKSTFDDIVPEQSLQQVLQLARDSSYWPADLILATGDLVHDPVSAAYEKFHKLVNALDVSVFCLPGNHDDPELMPQVLNKGNVSTEKEIHSGNWVLLLLNSYIPNTHGGELSKEELHWLYGKLAENKDKSILIALHHHPVSIQSTWMDSMILRNGEEFMKLIDDNSQVKLVLWGHIHQEFESQRQGTMLIGSPSTCVQFLPEATEYGTDAKLPGFRQIRLYADGSLSSSVVRLS